MMNIDYYKLYDTCCRNVENIKLKNESIRRNKRNKQKSILFSTIIKNSYEIILNRSKEGFDDAIIYDNDYNELIHELRDDLKKNFKPFNIIYKKKNFNDRSIMEIITEDINYILVIDWKKQSDKEMTELNKPNVSNHKSIQTDLELNNKQDKFIQTDKDESEESQQELNVEQNKEEVNTEEDKEINIENKIENDITDKVDSPKSDNTWVITNMF